MSKQKIIFHKCFNFDGLALYKNARILIVFKQNHIRKERRKMNLHQALVKVQTDFKNSQQNVYNYFDLLASRKLALMPKMVEIHGFGKDKPIAIDTKSNTAKQFLNEVLIRKDGLYINSVEMTAENALTCKANNFNINVTLIQIANSVDYVLVLDFDISKLMHGLKFIKLNGLEHYLNHASVIQANKNLLNRYQTFYNFVYQIQDEETTLANALGSSQENRADLNQKFADEKPTDQVIEESNVKKVKPELVENDPAIVEANKTATQKTQDNVQEFDSVRDMPQDNLDQMLDSDQQEDSANDAEADAQAGPATFDELLKSIEQQNDAKSKRKHAQPIKGETPKMTNDSKKPISVQKYAEQVAKQKPTEPKTANKLATESQSKIKAVDQGDSQQVEKVPLKPQKPVETEENDPMNQSIPEEKPAFAQDEKPVRSLTNVNPVNPDIPMIDSLNDQEIEHTEITPSLHRQMRTPVRYARQHSSNDLKTLADALINHFDTVLIKMTQSHADISPKASTVHNTAVLSSRAQIRERDDEEMAREFDKLDVL